MFEVDKVFYSTLHLSWLNLCGSAFVASTFSGESLLHLLNDLYNIWL